MRGDWEVSDGNEQDRTLAGVGALAIIGVFGTLVFQALQFVDTGMTTDGVLEFSLVLGVLGVAAIILGRRPAPRSADVASWVLGE